jgi:hypothetical protein
MADEDQIMTDVPPTSSDTNAFDHESLSTSLTFEAANGALRLSRDSRIHSLSTGIMIDASDPYRIGLHNALLLTPFQHIGLESMDPLHNLWLSLKARTEACILDCNIIANSVQIYYRTPDDYMPSAADTIILTIAPRQVTSDAWIHCIDRILSGWSEATNHTIVPKVDICDPRAFHGKQLFPMSPGHYFDDLFETFRPALHEALKPMSAYIYIHDVVRYGYVDDETENLTVFISSKASCKSIPLCVVQALQSLKVEWDSKAAHPMKVVFNTCTVEFWGAMAPFND